MASEKMVQVVQGRAAEQGSRAEEGSGRRNRAVDLIFGHSGAALPNQDRRKEDRRRKE